MTNFEKIKNMTVKEMAIAILQYSNTIFSSCEYCKPEYIRNTTRCSGRCKSGIIAWLESEVENNDKS